MFEILAFWICRDSASNIQCDISVIKDHQHSKPPPRKNVEFCDLNSTRGYLSLHCEEWCHLNGESWPMYLTLWISLSKTTIKLTRPQTKEGLVLHSGEFLVWTACICVTEKNSQILKMCTTAVWNLQWDPIQWLSANDTLLEYYSDIIVI